MDLESYAFSFCIFYTICFWWDAARGYCARGRSLAPSAPGRVGYTAATDEGLRDLLIMTFRE